MTIIFQNPMGWDGQIGKKEVWKNRRISQDRNKGNCWTCGVMIWWRMQYKEQGRLLNFAWLHVHVRGQKASSQRRNPRCKMQDASMFQVANQSWGWVSQTDQEHLSKRASHSLEKKCSFHLKFMSNSKKWQLLFLILKLNVKVSQFTTISVPLY